MTTERSCYNRIVELERSRNGDAVTEEMLTFGQLHFDKWDRAEKWEKENPSQNIDLETVQTFYEQCTEREVNKYRADARDTLQDYAIRYHQKQKSRNFRSGVYQGIVAAFLYSLLLYVAYQLLRVGNIDIFTLLGLKSTSP